MNVLDLLGNRGVEAKKAASTGGGEYWSACPGCGGHDRFHVWPDQNSGMGSYWCRQCEKHGDNIQFLMDFDKKTYPEACRALDVDIKSNEYRTPKPMSSWMNRTNKDQETRISDPKKEKTSSLLSDVWVEKGGKFVEWAHEKLLADKKQIKWLRDRGINTAFIKKFKLGWNPGKNGKDLFRSRESWGLETVIKSNNRKKALWFPIGLVIPLIKNGRVVRVRIRRPQGEPRYYVIPGSVMDMMFIGQHRRAYVVIESELDAILACQEAGDLVGVVGIGSSSAKPDPLLMEMLHQSAVILLLCDYDNAGAKMATWWEGRFPQSELWLSPKGRDPGEAYQAGVDIRAWIRAGLPSNWHIGPSLLGRKKERVGTIHNPASKNRDAGVPASVLELADLLRQHPVMILNKPDRLKVCEGQKWASQNWETSKRISHLVYMNPEVFCYLAQHPEEKITGKNFF